MAAEYLPDSNILIAMMRGEPRALLNKVASIAAPRFHLSSIVYAELRTGAEKSEQAASVIATLERLAADMTPAPFDADDAIAYSRIRAALERKGAITGPMDLLIAAQAVARGLALITDNVREFKRVPGLHVENWIR